MADTLQTDTTRVAERPIETTQARRLLTDAVLIALCTAVAYFSAWIHAVEYAEAFNILRELVEISLTAVVKAGLLLALIILLCLTGLHVLMSFIVVMEARYRALLRRATPLLIFGAAAVTIAAEPTSKLLGVVVSMAMVVVIVLVDFILPLITQRKRQGFFNKLEDQRSLVDSLVSTSIEVDALMFKGFSRTLLIVVLCSGMFIWINTLGEQASTSSKTTFLVRNTNPETVVLAVYGDKMVAATFDPTTKALNNDMYIVKWPEDQKVSYKYEAVGPLKAIPNK